MADNILYNLAFEEDSDDDIQDPDIIRRPRWIQERRNYFEEYDDRDFVIRFRLSKPSALSVLEQIENQLEFPSERNASVSPVNQLLTTLRFYATGCDQLSAGDFAGFSKSTANRIVHRVSVAIASLRPNYIRFPETKEQQAKAQMEFYNIARFPRAIGAMDCTHIRTISPGGDNAELYRNRKGYFSLNVQAICNPNLEFCDIVARWPGSTHDSTIFNNSYRRAMFEQMSYGNSVLLVDGGYACRSYLMPPLEQPRTREEHLYNESQIRSRNTIERLFGCWKRRFPVLALGLRVKLQNIFPIIVATAVLHNILRQAGEDVPPDDPTLQLPAPWEVLLREGDVGTQRGQQHGNDAVRRSIIDNYFRSLQ